MHLRTTSHLISSVDSIVPQRSVRISFCPSYDPMSVGLLKSLIALVLGLPYDFAIDIWSVGCTLYELYTGKILFTGRTNNQMLRSIMECRGKFSHRQLRKAQFGALHFDDLLNFRSVERDQLTGKVCRRRQISLVFSPSNRMLGVE